LRRGLHERGSTAAFLSNVILGVLVGSVEIAGATCVRRRVMRTLKLVPEPLPEPWPETVPDTVPVMPAKMPAKIAAGIAARNRCLRKRKQRYAVSSLYPKPPKLTPEPERQARILLAECSDCAGTWVSAEDLLRYYGELSARENWPVQSLNAISRALGKMCRKKTFDRKVYYRFS
jgi:hypothetical protein